MIQICMGVINIEVTRVLICGLVCDLIRNTALLETQKIPHIYIHILYKVSFLYRYIHIYIYSIQSPKSFLYRSHIAQQQTYDNYIIVSQALKQLKQFHCIYYFVINYPMCQWYFPDPNMQVLYHIRPYVVGIFPYIGLKYGRYLQFRYLKLPLNVSP